MHRTLESSLWLPVLMLAAACDPAEPPSDIDAPSAERCATLDGALDATAEPEVGILEGERFMPLSDGDDIILYRGHQGGYMITPAVRLPATGDADKVCTAVQVYNDVVGDSDVVIASGLRAQVLLTRQGEHMQSGYFDDLLAYDDDGLIGVELDVAIVIDPDGMNARAERRVVLAPER